MNLDTGIHQNHLQAFEHLRAREHLRADSGESHPRACSPLARSTCCSVDSPELDEWICSTFLVVDLEAVAALGEGRTGCGLALPTDCSGEACWHLDLLLVQGKAKNVLACPLLEKFRAGANIPVQLRGRSQYWIGVGIKEGNPVCLAVLTGCPPREAGPHEG